MKIALIGATGFVGSALLNELAGRGHDITAIARNPETVTRPNVKWAKADVTDIPALSEILSGHDAVVSAYNAGWTNPNIYDDFIAGSKAVQEAVKKSGVNRYIVIGGGGSLYVAPGLQAVDTPDFPKEYFVAASAARDYLTFIRDEKDLDWAFFSPALEMHQGITTGRTGKYRIGGESPVFDENNRSIHSVEDLAVAIADETENPKHHRARFTAAY